MKRAVMTIMALGLVVVGWRSWYELSRLDVTRGPTRAAWQLPSRVVDSLGVEAGYRIADIGAGDGYFTFRLAEAVGPAGRVYAVDVDPPAIERLEKKVQVSDFANIDVIQGELEDPRLPDGSIDLVFLCNTYHHLESRPDYFASLQNDLKPGARVAIVEMRDDVTGIGSLFVDRDHWTRWELLHGEMEIAGYRLEERFDFLPMQNFGVFKPVRTRSRPSSGS